MKKMMAVAVVALALNGAPASANHDQGGSRRQWRVEFENALSVPVCLPSTWHLYRVGDGEAKFRDVKNGRVRVSFNHKVSGVASMGPC